MVIKNDKDIKRERSREDQQIFTNQPIDFSCDLDLLLTEKEELECKENRKWLEEQQNLQEEKDREAIESGRPADVRNATINVTIEGEKNDNRWSYMTPMERIATHSAVKAIDKAMIYIKKVNPIHTNGI
jgi:hypothetical protein